MGVVSLLSERSARSPTSPGRVSERRTLPLWDLGREVLSKNAESLRDSDALMRVAVPRRRGPAGLRDLFRFCRNCGLYALRSGPFRVCEARGGITTLSALYVLLKRRTPACQNGVLCRFGILAGRCSRRTQRACGAAMRLCASLFRGVAAPLDCVIFFASAEIAVCTSCAQGFPRVRDMGGITTLGVLCVLLKRRTAACKSG